MRYIALVIIIITISCKSQKDTLAESEKKETVPEELALVLSDNYGGTEQQEIQVIRDFGTLKRFFSEINKTRKPGIPVPTIDFTKQMVVIYCSGKTTSSQIPGLHIVGETDDTMTLAIKRQNVQGTSSTALVMPFGLYAMTRSEKQVVLDKME